jgi:hypothetical protein
MSLVPKITATVTDKIRATTISLLDTTGAYNASTNPGGYGTPNYATSDLDWALIYLRNYENTDYNIQKLSSLTAILGAGQTFAGITDSKFGDGVWEVKYYPVVANPVTPGVDTAITWTVGSKTFALTGAATLLAGAKAILVKDVSDTKLYFLDSLSTNSATVTEQLPSTGTGFLAIAYEADTRFLITAAADDCLAIKTGLIIKECSCFDPEMQEMLLRMGKRQGADIHFDVKQNYQAAHDIIIQLASYCDNTSKCGC